MQADLYQAGKLYSCMWLSPTSDIFRRPFDRAVLNPIFPWKNPSWLSREEFVLSTSHTGEPSERLACRPIGMLCLEESEMSAELCTSLTVVKEGEI